MIYVQRKETFNAAHQLWNPEWSKEKNFKTFGPCANPNFHGHNFELIVVVCGFPDEKTGFIIDLKILGELINEHVCMALDHKNLNLDVPFMQGKITSCENLIVEIWKILDPLILQHATDNSRLYRITLQETPKNTFHYYGPNRKI